MKRFLLLALTVVGLLWVAPVQAHHVIFLDFSGFSLSAYPTVNGHTPPTAGDVTAVQELVIANMIKDYAPFDVHFVTAQPVNGRFTRVALFDDTAGGLFGCAGPGCCQFGNCTGIGTFTQNQSGCEVYAGSFASDTNFSGANATTARIANAISGTASHELGHVLGLFHCHAADDFVASGATCTDGFQNTTDQNVNFHIMASGASSGLTMSQRATRDRFFSIHSSRRVLYKNFQPRNHWNLFGDVRIKSPGGADLTFGRLSSPDIVQWFNSISNGTSFISPPATFASDAGDRADNFLEGDVDGDGRADLVIGETLSSNTVRWRVRLSTGAAFAAATTFTGDAGDAGHIYRLADVNGDGRKDLLFGVPFSSTTVEWRARLSTGTSFAAATVFITDAGNEGDLFLVARVTGGDARDDLVVVRRGSSGFAQIFRSTGTSFALETPSSNTFSNFNPDYVLLGDALFSDGLADLIVGTVQSNTQVAWDVAALDTQGCLIPPSTRVPCFAPLVRIANDIGDAGDLFRLGDGNADGRSDLFNARAVGMTSLNTAPNLTQIQWFGQASNGANFGASTTFATDMGDEGDLFP